MNGTMDYRWPVLMLMIIRWNRVSLATFSLRPSIHQMATTRVHGFPPSARSLFTSNLLFVSESFSRTLARIIIFTAVYSKWKFLVSMSQLLKKFAEAELFIEFQLTLHRSIALGPLYNFAFECVTITQTVRMQIRENEFR